MFKAFVFIFTLALAGVSAAEVPATASPKLGFVDMQKAIQSVQEGKDAKKKLERENATSISTTSI